MSFVGTHELAVVETDRIGEGVAVGPYCVIGPEVTLDDGNQVDVQLDEQFNVVSDKVEAGENGDDDDGPDDGAD